MKTVLAALILFAVVLHSEGLKCFTCVAHNQEECNRQGSSVCPATADACSTITATNTVLKSCSYKSFCDKAQVNSGQLECCFTDDCNGPHHSHSHGDHNSVLALSSSPVLLLGVLMVRVAVSSL